ncbi:MAG: 3-oxoacyl-[acyl-carrier protein] reductase, partial [uncultured Solirubrobacteraceae bacterium]
ERTPTGQDRPDHRIGLRHRASHCRRVRRGWRLGGRALPRRRGRRRAQQAHGRSGGRTCRRRPGRHLGGGRGRPAVRRGGRRVRPRRHPHEQRGRRRLRRRGRRPRDRDVRPGDQDERVRGVLLLPPVRAAAQGGCRGGRQDHQRHLGPPGDPQRRRRRLRLLQGSAEDAHADARARARPDADQRQLPRPRHGPHAVQPGGHRRPRPARRAGPEHSLEASRRAGGDRPACRLPRLAGQRLRHGGDVLHGRRADDQPRARGL